MPYTKNLVRSFIPTRHNTLPVIKRREEFGALLEHLDFRVGAEIGVQRGVFAEEILKSWSNCSKYYLIDCWQKQNNYHDRANVDDEVHESFFVETQTRLASYREKIHVLRMFSTEAAEFIDDASLDYIYIDARHDYESVLADMEAFLPKIGKGGIMAGHDFVDNDFVLTQGDHWSVGPLGERGNGAVVKDAVQDFTRKYGKQLIVCYADGLFPSWYFLV